LTQLRIDYPALVTRREAEQIEGFTLQGKEEAQVQGVVVLGLTDVDLAALIEFEGDVSFRFFLALLPRLRSEARVPVGRDRNILKLVAIHRTFKSLPKLIPIQSSSTTPLL